jgi:PAS domain-containing protein
MQRLHHSEANYRLLVDHLQAGVVVHGPDTRIEMCNQAAANLLGIDRRASQRAECAVNFKAP